jgi:pilus assembly protein Flp/PilA
LSEADIFLGLFRMTNNNDSTIPVNFTESEEKKTERGASLVEYALLVALIAIVCIAAVTALGRTVSRQFSSLNTQLTG